MSISASAVLSLQTRINNERSRRGLSSVGFTGGVTSGSNIRAPHINELRSYTETLNTMGSVSFGWSGNVAAGENITDALSQISSYCTTLEGESLGSWHTLTPVSVGYRSTINSVVGSYFTYSGSSGVRNGFTNDKYYTSSYKFFAIPSQILGNEAGNIRVIAKGGLSHYNAYQPIHGQAAGVVYVNPTHKAGIESASYWEVDYATSLFKGVAGGYASGAYWAITDSTLPVGSYSGSIKTDYDAGAIMAWASHGKGAGTDQQWITNAGVTFVANQNSPGWPWIGALSNGILGAGSDWAEVQAFY